MRHFFRVPAPLPFVEVPPLSTNIMLGQKKNQSEGFAEEVRLLSVPGIEPRFLGHVGFILVIIPKTQFCLFLYKYSAMCFIIVEYFPILHSCQ